MGHNGKETSRFLNSIDLDLDLFKIQSHAKDVSSINALTQTHLSNITLNESNNSQDNFELFLILESDVKFSGNEENSFSFLKNFSSVISRSLLIWVIIHKIIMDSQNTTTSFSQNSGYPDNHQQSENPKEIQEMVQNLKKNLELSLVQQIKKEENYSKKPESLSRIYHKIANIKKHQKINSNGLVKIEKDAIQPISKNDYKDQWDKKKEREEQQSKQKTLINQSKLILEETEQVRGIEEKVKQVGARMNSSILKQSENITRLLAQCLDWLEKDMKSSKYGLKEDEALKVAEISRNASSYHDNGGVLLLVHIVGVWTKLEREGPKIEKKMQTEIRLTHKQYPPGTGLTKEQIITGIPGKYFVEFSRQKD